MNSTNNRIAKAIYRYGSVASVQYCYLDSPVGPLLIAEHSDAIRTIRLPQDGLAEPPQAGWIQARPSGALGDAVSQLREYFAGKRRQFDLPLDPQGTTFQKRVWTALAGIPYGESISYIELARRAGNPKGSRAVGQANGRNPLPIVVPCHRVIAADGSLGGFGGGLATKVRLLALEGLVNSKWDLAARTAP